LVCRLLQAERRGRQHHDAVRAIGFSGHLTRQARRAPHEAGSQGASRGAPTRMSFGGLISYTYYYIVTHIMSVRPVKRIVQSSPTVEGAGVKLRRAFGFGDTSGYDPFLLLDDFRNDTPADYLAGFPWHPHRGIETITYVLAGTVTHGDSLGNRGTLGSGDVQWMTAGRGILHQEMPRGDAGGRMHGFQLWANLPASLNMTAPPHHDLKAAALPEPT